MRESFKYAKNGICRFENFAEHLAAGTFPTIDLGWLCGTKWYSELRIDEDDGEICPAIYCDNDDPKVKHSVQIYYNLLNNSGKNKETEKKTDRRILLFDKVSVGFYTPIPKILNLENGWLNDGALSFEYGIQVEAIYEDSIWTFNFNDKLFNAGAEQVQFDSFYNPNTVVPLYAHKVLLSFHSTIFEEWPKLGWTDEQHRKDLIDFFQICHGVRLNFDKKFENTRLLDVAYCLKMRNVTSYCDLYLAQTMLWERLKVHGIDWIQFAIKYNLRHFLASMVKSMTSLKEFVSEEDVEKLSNESMKMLVAKF